MRKSVTPLRGLPGEVSVASKNSADQRYDNESVLMAYIIQIARRYRAALDEQLRATGCGTAAMETLSTIAVLKRPSQIEVANRMGIESATLTRMLALLERKGWVARVTDPADGRAKLIQLTPPGAQVLKKVRAIADKFRRQTWSEVGDGDMTSMRGICEQVLQRIIDRA